MRYLRHERSCRDQRRRSRSRPLLLPDTGRDLRGLRAGPASVGSPRRGSACRPCSRVLVARCVHCGELGRIARVRTRGRVGWCVRCVGLPMLEPAEPVQVGGLAAQVASSAGTSPPACAGCGRVRRVTAYLPDGPRCGSCYDTAMGRAEECSRCHERRRVFFTPGICAGCLGVSIGGVCAACGAEDRLYSAGRCVRCELRVRVSELFEDAGEPGRAVAGLLTSSGNPEATLQWLARSSAVPILVEHVPASGSRLTRTWMRSPSR